LALDGEHFEENNENGTMTIKKLNRQWKLADNIDLHSVLAFFTADGNVEIMASEFGGIIGLMKCFAGRKEEVGGE
jgi:hypothetical protein